jgi:heme oxygenase
MIAVPPQSIDAVLPLAERLRHATWSLHREAERSGYVAEILRGRAEPAGYALLLRNLHPAYVTLETALSRVDAHPALRLLRHPPLHRAEPLACDLESLAGPDWRISVPLLPAGARYEAAVNAASRGDGVRLVAHAYVRYLGDLAGGQIMARIIGRSLRLEHGSLAFHRFEGDTIEHLAMRVRQAIGLVTEDDADRVVAEAARAFRLNIELSRAVAVSAADARPSAIPGARAAPSSG